MQSQPDSESETSGEPGHIASAVMNPHNARVAELVIKRYADGYRVASVTETTGILVKILSGLLFLGALLCVLLGVFCGTYSAGSADPMSAFLFWGGIKGMAVAVFVFILGVIISACGQMVKAQVDVAVTSSPFLSKREMAQMMNL